jgi:hypothetical protein
MQNRINFKSLLTAPIQHTDANPVQLVLGRHLDQRFPLSLVLEHMDAMPFGKRGTRA